MFLPRLLRFAVMVFVMAAVSAHVEFSPSELAEHEAIIARGAEAMNHCLEDPEMQGLHNRVAEERAATLHHIRKARGIDVTQSLDRRTKEDWLKWVSITHENDRGHSRDPQDLFNFRWPEPSKKDPACILAPTNIYGPYWRDGKQVERQDIRERQPGIYLRLALQVFDVNTCKPVHGSQVDVWQANAVGVYSDKVDGFLRGWQPSSVHGTVDFDTIFPGHYTQRTTHIHITVHPPKESRYSHFGMVYFDDELITEIEKKDPYPNNKAKRVLNKYDGNAPMDSTKLYDPFLQWAWIGNRVEDGVLAWKTLGVNLTDKGIKQPPGKRSLIDYHLD